LVEAVDDCTEAAALDPDFIKVHARRGRALLRLGDINGATEAFMFVLGWQNPLVDHSISDDTDRFGKVMSKEAMKQVILAKTLRDRLEMASPSNSKQNLQTVEELLSLCPHMRQVL
jgi:hypothetical protein